MEKQIKEIKFISFAVCLFFFTFLLSGPIYASNHVKVATIGTRPPVMDKTRGMQKMVEEVITFWDGQLKQVLTYKPDLIVLPEACDRPGGLTRNEQFEYFKARGDQVLNFLASVAKINSCYIVFGTKHLQEEGVWRNSSILLNRQGEIAGIYNKNYPTIDEIESGIVPGKEAPVFKCDFGTVACVICYDLNFTDLCNKYMVQKPDILVFSSMYHGGLMQSYWAYQCRSYFVGAMGFREIPSEIRNPLGEVVASSTNYFDFTVATINLDCELVHLDNNWDHLKRMKEKYGDAVTITDPGRLGPVLITSEHETVSAEEMTKEFGMELLDNYFNRSMDIRQKNIID